MTIGCKRSVGGGRGSVRGEPLRDVCMLCLAWRTFLYRRATHTQCALPFCNVSALNRTERTHRAALSRKYVNCTDHDCEEESCGVNQIAWQ